MRSQQVPSNDTRQATRRAKYGIGACSKGERCFVNDMEILQNGWWNTLLAAQSCVMTAGLGGEGKGEILWPLHQGMRNTGEFDKRRIICNVEMSLSHLS
jgi:hypothetical protein